MHVGFTYPLMLRSIFFRLDILSPLNIWLEFHFLEGAMTLGFKSGLSLEHYHDISFWYKISHFPTKNEIIYPFFSSPKLNRPQNHLHKAGKED